MPVIKNSFLFINMLYLLMLTDFRILCGGLFGLNDKQFVCSVVYISKHRYGV